MRQDMHVCHADTKAAVRLRRNNGQPVLFAMTDALGITSDVAMADFFGVSTKTISRLRANATTAHHLAPPVQIGEKFMANAVTALRRHTATLALHGQPSPTLDELFDVVDTRVLAKAA